MNMNIPVIIVSNIFLVIAIYKFMNIYFDKRKTRSIVQAISYLPFAVLITGRDLLNYYGIFITIFGSGFATLILVYLLTVFIISLTYESSMIKRVVATCYAFIARDVTLALVSNFILIHIPQTELVTSTVALHLFGNLAFLLVALVLGRNFKHLKKDFVYTPAFCKIAISIAVSIIMIGFLRHMYFPGFSLYYSIVIVFALSIFLVFYLSNSISETYDNNLRAALNAKASEYYLSQCKLMQESVEQVKSMRHDIKIHLSTARNFTAKNMSSEATEYLDNLLGSIAESKLYSDTGNIAFDSIINFKLTSAKSSEHSGGEIRAEDFEPEIRLLVPPEINMDVADIVTILGNLLDNALDALRLTDEKTLKLDVEYSKGSLFIKVDNSFDGMVKYGRGKDSSPENIVSRKSGIGHGYGLKNIRNAVEKYGGHLDISHEGNVFSVGVLIYLGG